jgi:hypothetical protein
MKSLNKNIVLQIYFSGMQDVKRIIYLLQQLSEISRKNMEEVGSHVLGKLSC